MSDFWLGIILGYIIGNIVAFLVEMLCIATGNSDVDKWMDKEEE